MELFWNYESSLYSFEIGTIIAVIEGKLQFSLCATCVKVARQYKLIQKSVMYVAFYRNACFPLNHFFSSSSLSLSLYPLQNQWQIHFIPKWLEPTRAIIIIISYHSHVCVHNLVSFHCQVGAMLQKGRYQTDCMYVFVYVWIETRKKNTKIGTEKSQLAMAL